MSRSQLLVAIVAIICFYFPMGSDAGCSASGVTGTDNAGDCAALLAAYKAWGDNPTSWAAQIAMGSSYCVWNHNLECTGFRVSLLCDLLPSACPTNCSPSTLF